MFGEVQIQKDRDLVRIGTEDFQQISACESVRPRVLMQVKLCDQHIHEGDRCADDLPGVLLLGELENERNLDEFIEQLRAVAPTAVIEKFLAVITEKPDDGVVVQATIFQALQKTPN